MGDEKQKIEQLLSGPGGATLLENLQALDEMDRHEQAQPWHDKKAAVVAERDTVMAELTAACESAKKKLSEVEPLFREAEQGYGSAEAERSQMESSFAHRVERCDKALRGLADPQLSEAYRWTAAEAERIRQDVQTRRVKFAGEMQNSITNAELIEARRKALEDFRRDISEKMTEDLTAEQAAAWIAERKAALPSHRTDGKPAPDPLPPPDGVRSVWHYIDVRRLFSGH